MTGLRFAQSSKVGPHLDGIPRQAAELAHRLERFPSPTAWLAADLLYRWDPAQSELQSEVGELAHAYGRMRATLSDTRGSSVAQELATRSARDPFVSGLLGSAGRFGRKG